MSGQVLVVGVVVLAASAALLVIGALSHHDRVPRNRWVGVRTPATMRSDDAWFAAQRSASPFLLIAGVLGVLTGVFWLVVAPEEGDDAARALIIGFVVVLTGPSLLGAVAGVRAARRVGRELDGDGPLSAGP
jgi:uncharacterized membrane protein